MSLAHSGRHRTIDPLVLRDKSAMSLTPTQALLRAGKQRPKAPFYFDDSDMLLNQRWAGPARGKLMWEGHGVEAGCLTGLPVVRPAGCQGGMMGQRRLWCSTARYPGQ